MKKHSAEWFIAKFEAIPDAKWTTGLFQDMDGRKCAIGHCLGTTPGTLLTEESEAFGSILNSLGGPVTINDGVDRSILVNGKLFLMRSADLGDTPKERILNALTLVATGVIDEL